MSAKRIDLDVAGKFARQLAAYEHDDIKGAADLICDLITELRVARERPNDAELLDIYNAVKEQNDQLRERIAELLEERAAVLEESRMDYASRGFSDAAAATCERLDELRALAHKLRGETE